MKRIAIKLLIISVLSGGGAELVLRKAYGFCDAPLSIESKNYEYCFAPNQSRKRFGNLIKYNSFSMRCEEPWASGRIIIGCGDSVINGGVQTDQKDLATSIFTEETGVQMLNVSAGSWGPDNCAAYLNTHGLFGAEGIILCISSHDAYDNMDFKPIVGKSESFPEKQYFSAIVELIDRYLLPRIKNVLKLKTEFNDNDPDAVVNAGIQKAGSEFNPGFEELRLIAENNHLKFAIYLHPEKNEVEVGMYNTQGQEIISWANDNSVSLYLGLNEGESIDGFRDNIHLNKTGQRILANTFEKIYSEW